MVDVLHTEKSDVVDAPILQRFGQEVSQERPLSQSHWCVESFGCSLSRRSEEHVFMISRISMYFLENQRYSQMMLLKFRVLPGLCMFFLLFQFEKKHRAQLFCWTPAGMLRRRWGLKRPVSLARIFGSSNLTPEEKKRKKKERKGGVLVSAKRQYYTVHDF